MELSYFFFGGALFGALFVLLSFLAIEWVHHLCYLRSDRGESNE